MALWCCLLLSSSHVKEHLDIIGIQRRKRIVVGGSCSGLTSSIGLSGSIIIGDIVVSITTRVSVVEQITRSNRHHGDWQGL